MSRRTFLWSMLLAVLWVWPSVTFGAVSGNQLWEKYRNAVVRISVNGTKADGSRHRQDCGSGLIVYSNESKTVVVTAAHVVKSNGYWDKDAYDRPRRELTVGQLDDHQNLRVIADKDITILHNDDGNDWAVLQFHGEGYPTMHLGELKPGDHGYVLGFSNCAKLVEISPADTKVINYGDQEGHKIRLHSRVDEGQSGGPILDEDGQVGGIASANQMNTVGIHLAVPINIMVNTLKIWVPPKAKFWSVPGGNMPNVNQIIEPQNAFGLRVNSIHWNHYYRPNGDFLGMIAYDVTNVAKFPVEELLPDKAGWFGKGIDAEHSFDILSEDKINFYTLKESLILKYEKDEVFYGDNKALTYFLWLPRVTPGLRPGDNLKYAVKIETKGTEKDAFALNGSYAGMATMYPTELLVGEVYAPPGNRIINQGFVIRDRAGGALIESHADIDKPILSDDKTRLTWNVRYPVVSALYLLSLRFEPVQK